MTEELRVHTRVEVDVACEARSERGVAFAARVVDISRGGAAIIALPGLAQFHELLVLDIEPFAGDAERVTVAGEVVRTAPSGELCRYGIRFSSMPPASAKALRRFISQALAGAGVGTREHTRVYRRIPVTCHSTDEFRAIIQNISRGGLGAVAEVPVVVGEPIVVEIQVQFRDKPLAIPGVVTYVRSLGQTHHQVGIKFAPMPDDKREKLQKALDEYIAGLTLGTEPEKP
jgi:c-di-GMP-binding flagellar brake protein YcgR